MVYSLKYSSPNLLQSNIFYHSRATSKRAIDTDPALSARPQSLFKCHHLAFSIDNCKPTHTCYSQTGNRELIEMWELYDLTECVLGSFLPNPGILWRGFRCFQIYFNF